MVWTIGQKLYGNREAIAREPRYIVEKQLSTNNFVISYLALNLNGSRFLIKTLKDWVINDPDMADYRDRYIHNFDQTALRLSLCRHPHIVAIDNAFYEGLLPCIVTEYIQGQTLWQLVRSNGPLPESLALDYIQQISSAIALIHSKGFLHRDIKPWNIMVRAEQNSVVLTDIGIAGYNIPQINDYFTEGFSAPEAYISKHQSGQYTDVYSLAAILYFLLTGIVPTPAFALASNQTLVPPKDYNPGISEWMNQLILLGMEYEPFERPSSIQEWLDLLDFRPRGGVNWLKAGFQNLGKTILDRFTNKTDKQEVGFLLPDDLSSTANINYNKLRDLLKAGNWLEADRETETVMLKIANREKEGWLDLAAIEAFPSTDLRTIDQLWLKYSNGRFGFSVQQQIWSSIGGNNNSDYDTWCKFADRVGWCRGKQWLHINQLTYSMRAPEGHLPNYIWSRDYKGVWGLWLVGLVRWEFSAMAEKLAQKIY